MLLNIIYVIAEERRRKKTSIGLYWERHGVRSFGKDY